MDPLTVATSFATIVALIADFKSQHLSDSDDEFKEFTSWLSENRHTELLSLVQQNANTILSIKVLLATNRKVLEERLEILDKALAGIASTLDGFSQLASAVRPDASLSTQAISILQQFNDAGASHALELKNISSPHALFVFVDGVGGEVTFSEPKFIEDDILSLVNIGLLRLGYNAQGERKFWFTRTAATLVANFEKE